MAVCFYLEILTLRAAQPAIPLEHLIGIWNLSAAHIKTDKAKEKILKLIFITEQGCASRIKAFKKPLS